MKTVLLHCEIGNHDWERPSQRGKRPKSCPDCRSDVETTAAVVRESRPLESIERVQAFKDWCVRDAELRMAFGTGVITRAEMKTRIGPMPAIPTANDYQNYN